MEEEDEIQSHPSSASGSPSSPRPNGRITVTVAAPPPPPQPSQTTVNLALPAQQPKSGGGGREDCWSEGATAVLIDAWGERYLELSRGNLKQKHWKEVADIVSSREDYTKAPKTDIQCKNRIDTVKKKYKLEKAKIVAGGGLSKWPFFEKLDRLIGSTAKNVGSGGVGASSPAASTPSLQIQKVPVGVPVGIRSTNQYQAHLSQQPKGLKTQTRQFRKRGRVETESSGSERETSPASTDSFPPEIFERKKVKIQKEVNPNPARIGSVIKEKNEKKEMGWGNVVRELTQAILKFGETYEQTESAKLQQAVEMEKQRMKFAKEMEEQRMRFFLDAQLQISQLKRGKRFRNTTNHHLSSKNNNNSDSSN